MTPFPSARIRVRAGACSTLFLLLLACGCQSSDTTNFGYTLDRTIQRLESGDIGPGDQFLPVAMPTENAIVFGNPSGIPLYRYFRLSDPQHKLSFFLKHERLFAVYLWDVDEREGRFFFNREETMQEYKEALLNLPEYATAIKRDDDRNYAVPEEYRREWVPLVEAPKSKF